MESPISSIPHDTSLTEENFHHYTIDMRFTRHEVAFVMVDLWNTGFGPEPLSHLGWEAEYNAGKSFCDRAGKIELDKILPMLEACRHHGITIVHAPTRDIAVKHEQWAKLATEEERNPGKPKNSAEADSWPPKDWVAQWQKDHRYRFRTEQWITDYYREVRPNQDIPAPLHPVDGDLVITCGSMMHRLMKEREIKVLFYCGFATNMCLIDKPGAIRDMHRRGYLPIVIRDATTGTENAETVGNLGITRAMIDQIEMRWGYSITTDDFLTAAEGRGPFDIPARYLRMYKPLDESQ
jgi:nicotinamidase-related amidase